MDETEEKAGGEAGQNQGQGQGQAAAQQPNELLDMMRSMKVELESFRAEKSAREAEAARKTQEELVRKGQLDEIARNHAAALKAKDEALAALDKRARGAELRRSLTEALSGHELREGAAAQLLKLWGDEFEVHDDGDGFKVRSRSDLREPRAVFAERLKSPEYDHFLKASHRGGSGAGSDRARGDAAAQQAAAAANPFLAAAAALKTKYGRTDS